MKPLEGLLILPRQKKAMVISIKRKKFNLKFYMKVTFDIEMLGKNGFGKLHNFKRIKKKKKKKLLASKESILSIVISLGKFFT